MSDITIGVEKVRVHVGYKWSDNQAIVGLLFGFASHQPIDIDVSWINDGEAASSVLTILKDICANDPKEVVIDEEGEHVSILPENEHDSNVLKLTFTTNRQIQIPAFTVKVTKQEFINACKNAMKAFIATELQKPNDNDPTMYDNFVNQVNGLGD